MSDEIRPSAKALKEALLLSEEVLRNIELSEIPLTNAALKASRLARLLNEFQYQRVFEYEAGGYPGTPTGISRAVWQCAELAGRTYQKKDKEGTIKTYAITESIEQLEATVVGATREEADRYVVYTYMAVGDLLQLRSYSKQGQDSSASSEVVRYDPTETS